jgi:GTP-binding protein
MPSQKSPGNRTVVLVGRPNVGKSTLFNRLTGTRRAIVAPIAGTTRDVIQADADWQGATVTVVDTGGMFGASTDPLHALVLQQGQRAIATADLIVFVTDGRDGLVSGDEEIAAAVRQSGRPVILAVNKCDDRRARERVVEFYALGFDPVISIASEHGEGIGDLLDAVSERLALGTGRARPVVETPETKVAIIGRPNVGKSSLVNRLLKEERMVVSELAGTTRDPVDSILKWHRQQFRIVDTAGIRRAGKVAKSGEIEAVSVMLARRAIARADVAVLLVDAVEGATDQDATVAGEAERTGCGVIIAINKWDLIEDRSNEAVKRFDDTVRQTLKFLDYAPILHISARTGDRTPKLLEAIDRVARARLNRVPTGELNRFVEAVTQTHPPVSPGKRHVRVLYAAQTGVAPPTFVFFTNVATSFHFSYERFLANRLREAFGFDGTPIRLEVRARRGKGKPEEK